MNTKLLIAGMAALMLAAPATVAGTYHRDSVGPTTVNIDQLGEFGISLCDDTVGALVPALLCGTGGVGAIIDISGESGNTVEGTCAVAQDSAIVSQTNGDFSFSCGVDRDDDGFVTNVDTTAPDADNDPTTIEWDDDYAGATVSGPMGSGSVNVCFEQDVGASGFDDVAVFIAVNVPSTSVAVGTFDVDLSLTTNTCTPSGH
ncbi:MAG: hypothetical protein WC876_06355 [Candidatus Thermoplasmatota archaeon]|jgi:hypothetical protein